MWPLTCRSGNARAPSDLAQDAFQRGARRRVSEAPGVHRDRHDAGAAEAQGLELQADEIRITQSQIDTAEPEESGVIRREEGRRRDVVVLQDLRTLETGEGFSHRRRQREVEDRDVSSRRRRVAEWQHVPAQVVVYRECEQL